MSPAWAQGTPVSATPSSDDLRKILAEAFERNSLVTLRAPYHVLATFQTFAPDGTPAGDGSIERFAANGRMKTVTRFRGHVMTEYMEAGKRLYTDDGFAGSILLYHLTRFVLEPVPAPVGLERRDLEYKAMDLPGALMDCGMFQFYLMEGLPTPPKEVACVTRDTHDLGLAQTLRMSVRYREFMPFLGKSIARRFSVTQGTVVRARVHLDVLDETVPDEAALIAPPDASPASPGVNWVSTRGDEDRPRRRKSAVYPGQLRNAKVRGPAVVHVAASPTGEVIDVEPFYGPAPEMLSAAAEAAKGWLYPPTVRDGKAIATIHTVVIWFEHGTR